METPALLGRIYVYAYTHLSIYLFVGTTVGIHSSMPFWQPASQISSGFAVEGHEIWGWGSGIRVGGVGSTSLQYR